MIVYGAPRPKPRHEGEGFYGASPHAPTENHYIWGFAPNPTRGLFSPKVPETRKKTNWIRYILSSIDSEQGCRRQPCFLFGADSTAPRPHRRPARPPCHAASAARRAAPHSPVVHPTLTVVPSVIAPSPCTSRARPSPRRSFETACFRFFAKHFKLCGQLTERK